MNTYTVEVTIKRLLKVTVEDKQEAMAKAYQMLMQFKEEDVEPIPGLTMTIDLQDEKH